MPRQPLVSIVTPSYNMAAYLSQTIDSVLAQDYPRIEYLVMDGGSTDGTLAILDRYQDRLRYVSGPDRGAADAINRGFARSRGEILAWLNADDTYLPGAVSAVVRALEANSDAAVVYGEGSWIDTHGATLGRYPTRPFEPALLAAECFICQPACFLRRSAWEAAGGLDTTLQVTFDYDLWIRIAASGRPFVHLPHSLAASRMHSDNKTLGSRGAGFRESFRTLQRHYGYIPFNWIHGYAAYLIDRRDQFFEPLRPSIFKYCLSLPLGIRYNWKQKWRYLKEWCSVMTREGSLRWLRESSPLRILLFRRRA